MNLYVGNLLFDVTEDDLKVEFEKFGSVTEVRLIMDKFSGKSKGFAFIEMPVKDEAQNAISEMNEKEFMGRKIAVNVAKPKSDNRRTNPRARSGNSRSRPGQSRSPQNRSRGNNSRERRRRF